MLVVSGGEVGDSSKNIRMCADDGQILFGHGEATYL